MMNTILERITGLNVITDQVIALDMLNAAKTAVRNYAMAVTETATPEVKAMLIRHLDESLDLHEALMDYVMAQGWYQPWDPVSQFKADLQQIETALSLPS